MINNEFILKRHPENPIITPRDFPGAYAIYNPGQTIYQNKVLLMLPVHHNSMQYKGMDACTTVHAATSDDGVHFDIDPEPIFTRSNEEPFRKVAEQFVDFRITRMEDTYYVIHPGCGPWGTLAILGKTKDFKSFENIDIVSLPDNRMPCLFPEKINGLFCRIDRPYRVCPNDFHEFGNMWISYSPDLVFWGKHRPLLKPGYTHWNATKIGPTPPIKTPEGWLVIVHGVTNSCAGHRYAIGAILLDLADPEKIIGKTMSAILWPCEPCEFNGRVPNVVFPCGAVADADKDTISLYYGCADTYVGLATGSLSQLLEACRKGL